MRFLAKNPPTDRKSAIFSAGQINLQICTLKWLVIDEAQIEQEAVWFLSDILPCFSSGVSLSSTHKKSPNAETALGLQKDLLTS